MDTHPLDMVIKLTSMRITEGIHWQALHNLSRTASLFRPLAKRVKPALLHKLMVDATRARLWHIKFDTHMGFAWRVFKRKPWFKRWHYKYGCQARQRYKFIKWPKDPQLRFVYWQIENQIIAMRERAHDMPYALRHA